MRKKKKFGKTAFEIAMDTLMNNENKNKMKKQVKHKR